MWWRRKVMKSGNLLIIDQIDIILFFDRSFVPVYEVQRYDKGSACKEFAGGSRFCLNRLIEAKHILPPENPIFVADESGMDYGVPWLD